MFLASYGISTIAEMPNSSEIHSCASSLLSPISPGGETCKNTERARSGTEVPGASSWTGAAGAVFEAGFA